MNAFKLRENSLTLLCHCEPFDPSALLRAGFAQDRLREAISLWQ